MSGTTRMWALSGPHAGEWVERTGIDVRELLATGGWSLTPPDAGAPVTALPPADEIVAVPLAVTNSFDAEPARPMAMPKGRAPRQE